jgi:hypothetical protein
MQTVVDYVIRLEDLVNTFLRQTKAKVVAGD